MDWTGITVPVIIPSYVRVGKGKSMVSQADTEWSEQRLGIKWKFCFCSGLHRIKHSKGISKILKMSILLVCRCYCPIFMIFRYFSIFFDDCPVWVRKRPKINLS